MKTCCPQRVAGKWQPVVNWSGGWVTCRETCTQKAGQFSNHKSILSGISWKGEPKEWNSTDTMVVLSLALSRSTVWPVIFRIQSKSQWQEEGGTLYRLRDKIRSKMVLTPTYVIIHRECLKEILLSRSALNHKRPHKMKMEEEREGPMFKEQGLGC